MALAELYSTQDERRFPQQVLAGQQTALVLFCAAFRGRQDAQWVARAGLHATCVDVDQEKLEEMALMYPARWQFVEQDAYAFVDEALEAGELWDVVTADPPSNHFERVAADVPRLCALARHAVCIASFDSPVLTLPTGWRRNRQVHRSTYLGGIYWTVLVKKATGGSP